MIFKSGGQEARLALISTERHGNGAGVDNGAPPPRFPTRCRVWGASASVPPPSDR